MSFVKSNKNVLLFLFLLCLVNQSTSEKCADYIDSFPGFECINQLPIGTGASGTVYLIKHNHKKYALKIQSKTIKAIEEKLFLTKLKTNPFIIHLHKCIIQDKKQICLMEYGEKGPLFDLIHLEDPYFQSFKKTLLFFKKLVKGVRDMHKQDIIHADLKLQNIVVTSQNEPRIIDFDLAVKKNELARIRGTPKFMAPEIAKAVKNRTLVNYQEGIDMYSLGVVLYAMVKKTYPISAKISDYEEMVTSEIEFDKGDYVDFRDIVMKLICLKDERISASDLYELLIKILLKPEYEKLESPESYVLDSSFKKTFVTHKTRRQSIFSRENSQDDLSGISKIEKDKENRETYSTSEILIISGVSLIILICIVLLIWFRGKIKNRMTTNSFSNRLKKKKNLRENRETRSESFV
jgi:serine/threonine protein kinase